jgi:hypothetical protein
MNFWFLKANKKEHEKLSAVRGTPAEDFSWNELLYS